ncbi:MAG: hypothetical protein V7K48_03620 [Nostoc sp.]|uniref:hypothetical protein n=1 Tax=Nostoc sp. TaxID=1180 RepID=UPI002FF834BC
MAIALTAIKNRSDRPTQSLFLQSKISIVLLTDRTDKAKISDRFTSSKLSQFKCLTKMRRYRRSVSVSEAVAFVQRLVERNERPQERHSRS